MVLPLNVGPSDEKKKREIFRYPIQGMKYTIMNISMVRNRISIKMTSIAQVSIIIYDTLLIYIYM